MNALDDIVEDNGPLVPPTDPAPPPADVTNDVLLDAIRDMRRELRREIAASEKRSADRIIDSHQSIATKQREELEIAFTTLATAIGSAKEELTETIKRELASADRATSKDVDLVRGGLGVLAEQVSGLQIAVHDHLAVSTELRDRAYELAKDSAEANGSDSDDERITQADIGGE